MNIWNKIVKPPNYTIKEIDLEEIEAILYFKDGNTLTKTYKGDITNFTLYTSATDYLNSFLRTTDFFEIDDQTLYPKKYLVKVVKNKKPYIRKVKFIYYTTMGLPFYDCVEFAD